MQKSKVFSKKLIALVLSALMAVSTFFGVASTAYAYQNGDYHDDSSNIGANALSWVEVTDDATLEALLDSLDGFLYDADWDSFQKSINAIGIEDKLPEQIVKILGLQLGINLPNVNVSTSSVAVINIAGNVSSIDGIIDLMYQLKDAIASLKSAGNLASMIGYHLDTILNLNFDVFGTSSSSYFKNSVGTSAGYRDSSGSWRNVNSAKYIIRGVIKWLLIDNRNIFTDLLDGTLKLVYDNNNKDLVDLYGILGGLLGIDHDSWAYETSSNGMIYNVLKALLVKLVPLYEGTDHLKEEGTSWVFDTEGFKIANYYLQKLSFEITYPEYATFTGAEKIENGTDPSGEVVYKEGRFNDSSKRRYAQAVAAGKFDTSTGKIDSAYATAQGWDPNLVYSQEEGYEGNVLVAKYGNETLSVASTDTIYQIIWKALPIVWKTALKPTIELLHVNYNGHDFGSGTNFDNHYFYWVNEEYKVNGEYYEWKRGADYMDNYSDTIINAWAAAVYTDYNFSSANEFINYVKKTVTYEDSRVAKNDKYNWRDIDSSILFSEIRYSPLADHWGIQTGPLNLYFEQTGAPAVIDFFDTLFASKTAAGFPGSLISQIDNALVTAMDDLFPASENIGKAVDDGNGGYGGVESTSMPALSTTDATDVATVVSTLISDAAIIFKYSADATDANILNPFYNSEFADNGADTVITEDNIEQAVIPLAISALKHWNLTASIHNADWDKVCDIESGAVIALQEYLKYLYPDRDYSDLYELSDPMPMAANPDISYKFVQAIDGTTLLDHAIVPMAADALTFVLTAAGMPFFEQTSSTCSSSGAIIKPLQYTFVGKGDGLNNLFWQTLNATVCYFGVDKKIAALANAPNAISYSNTIWQNANNVINTLLPALAQLLGKTTAGSLDLKTFLWDDVVGSVADIGGNNGLSTILTYIGKLISNDSNANPLYTKSALNAVVFSVAKPLINLLLGSRTSTAADIIRVTESTSNPVDTFLKKSNINTSVFNLIDNLLQLTNAYNANETISGNAIHAAAFILQATHILPRINDNTVGGVSATLADHIVSSSSFSTRLAIRNESWGINDFYNDANNNVVEAGRYFATLKSIKIIDVSDNSDKTGLFVIAPNKSKDFMPVGNNSVALNPEQLTRVTISGNSTPVGVYRVEVTYDMARKDRYSDASYSKTYSNAKAVDFFSVSSSATGDLAWTDAFSGDYATSTELYQEAGLVTKRTSGTLDVYGPTLIVAGSNAASCAYGYNVENRQNSYDSDGNSTGYTGTTAKLNYATVAANTTGYTLKSGAASTSANDNAAYVAVNDDQEVILGDGSTVAFATALNTDGIGYIKNADDEYVALTVDKSKIGASGYRAGTPLRGVYLDTEQIDVPGRHDKNNTNGSAGCRIIANDSLSGRPTEYNKMNIVTSVGSFPLTIATGDIDGNYASLKNAAAGLAVHYYTAGVLKTNVTSLIIPAMQKTLASGVNLDNLANALNVKEEVETLLETAYATPTEELQAAVNNVIKIRRDRQNVNYILVANYEEAVKKAKEVESLVSIEYLWEKDGDEYAVDENGNWIPIYEDSSERYQAANYLSYAPCILLDEGARVFNSVYMPQAVLRTTGVFQLLYDEITHATSSTDEYDVLDGEFEYDQDTFDIEQIGTDYHQFPYSTKDEGEWDGVYSYKVTAPEELPVKFGTVVYDEDTEEYVLSNLKVDEKTGEYVQAYTTDSWTAYVDALGECINLSQYMDGDTNKTVHKAYDARSHLVIAENNLEIYDGEEPDDPSGDDTITITGKVVIATSLNGENGTDGIENIYVYADLNEAAVATTAEDGTFTAVVPKGTTSLTISNHTFANGAHSSSSVGTTIDRTVTLSGTADIPNAGNIPVIVCDWNSDGYVKVDDKASFNASLKATKGSALYKRYYDLNGDNSIKVDDKSVFNIFKGKVTKTYTYQAKSLD